MRIEQTPESDERQKALWAYREMLKQLFLLCAIECEVIAFRLAYSNLEAHAAASMILAIVMTSPALFMEFLVEEV